MHIIFLKQDINNCAIDISKNFFYFYWKMEH